MRVQEILHERQVQAQLIGQPWGHYRPAVQELRQLPERPGPLHWHRDRLLGPPAPSPQLGGQGPIVTMGDDLQRPRPPDQGLERHPPSGL
jgi:hypothetical protein